VVGIDFCYADWISCSPAGVMTRTNVPLASACSPFRCLAAMVMQCHVHEDVAAVSAKAHDQRFGVFSALLPARK